MSKRQEKKEEASQWNGIGYVEVHSHVASNAI